MNYFNNVNARVGFRGNLPTRSAQQGQGEEEDEVYDLHSINSGFTIHGGVNLLAGRDNQSGRGVT
jgi:hypothetical protein